MPDNPGYSGTGPGLDYGDVVEYLDYGKQAWDWLTGSDDKQQNTGTAVVPYTPQTTYSTPVANGGTIGGCPVTVAPQMAQRRSCPRGYVLVNDPQSGAAVCMLKGVASKCGLYRAPRKPPIKASDWRCLMKAGSVIKRLDTVVKKGNEIQGKAKYTRSRGRGR